MKNLSKRQHHWRSHHAGDENLVHQLDPSRKCTAAMDQWSSGAADGFSTVLDVQGFNYLNHGGEDSFHSSNPTMPCYRHRGTPARFSRAAFMPMTPRRMFPLTMSTLQAAIVRTAEAWWQFYTARPWDPAVPATGPVSIIAANRRRYGWPCINSHFGVMDTCGFPKDIYYYYQANWTVKTVLHIFPHWNWAGEQGQTINVWASAIATRWNCSLTASARARNRSTS